AGQENRFFPREVELSLFGQVDPYAYAEVRIETGEEARGQELGVKLAEASVTLLTLPLGTQAKFGQMRNRFGYSNMIHEHDLPWIDRPNVLRNFLGGEGLKEKGVEVTIVPDLPFYLEGLAGVFDGDNETAFGRGTLRVPLFTGRLRTFLELGDENAVQVGMSVASGETTEKQRDTLLGWEGRYKYRPDGCLHPLVTVTGEAIYSLRRVLVEADTDGDGIIDRITKREKDRFGWYAGAEVQPFRRWAAGVRYDWSEFPATPGTEAAKKLRVVATIPDLKSLTEAVGGDLVEVDALTRGTQNFHEAEVRPSMMLKLRRADALIENGVELDAWADVAVLGANNPNIVRGAAGRIEISRGISLLEVPSTRVDRSMGDVHPLGNPHFSLDPGLAPIITQNIVDGLARLSPDDRAVLESNRRAFLERLDREMARWNKIMEPVRGAKVIAYHPDVIYFLTRFGLVQVGTLEDRPGIPPSPQHLVQIIRLIKAEGVKLLLVQPWNDLKLAERVAAEAGAKAFVFASAVGAVKGADNYIAAIEFNVTALAQALK